MEDFGTYLSAIAASGAALIASAIFVIGDLILKAAMPKFHAARLNGELGRLSLVAVVSAGILIAGYSAWHAPYQELKKIQEADKPGLQQTSAAATLAQPPATAQTTIMAPAPVAQPASTAPRPTDAQINSGIDSLLFRASLIETEAGSFRGDYDHAAAASHITRWQTAAALFLRENIGSEAERDFRSVAPVTPNSQVGALLNGSATTAVGMFTAQREVLKAYRR